MTPASDALLASPEYGPALIAKAAPNGVLGGGTALLYAFSAERISALIAWRFWSRSDSRAIVGLGNGWSAPPPGTCGALGSRLLDFRRMGCPVFGSIPGARLKIAEGGCFFASAHASLMRPCAWGPCGSSPGSA
jgi:hypothetical protein